MKKLKGRDCINTHSISKKVNEIIELLEDKKIIEDNEDKSICKIKNMVSKKC